MSRELAVDIQGLTSAFRAEGRRVVVHRNLSLCIETGELVAIVGGSGSGKSVLLRQMLGLERPLRGQVRVLGRPADELSAPGAAARVGMLFQQGALFSAFSVLDNIALPLRELRRLPKDLVNDVAMMKLRMVGLEPAHAHKMPADLSGGMVKRAALARALVMDPPLLLLDEPTAGLDPNSADAFCDLLGELHGELGLTVVMVTHDLDTLFALSTQVGVLADQHIAAYGSPREVMQSPHPFIQEFFNGDRGRRAQALLQDSPVRE